MKAKKTLIAVVIVLAIGAVAYAVENPDPVRNNETQYRWLYRQWFNQEVDFNFIDAGTIRVTGAIIPGSSAIAGSVACDGGTPSPTVTVRAGAACVCNRTDTAAKCSVSSTTLTINCVAADTTSLPYICL